MNLRSWMAAACFALALPGTPGCGPTPPPSPYAFPVQLGTAGQDNAFGVAADGSGNVYIAGWTDGVFPGVAAEGYIDLFVVKLDGGGAQQWIQQYGTTKNDYARGVALDGSGNLYVAGYTTGTFPGFTNPGGAELLVIGLDGSGGMRWAQQLGAGDETVANGVATDSNGNVLVAGETFGSLPGFTSTGIVDLFVIKYDGGGARQWIQQMGAGGSLDSTHANGVATDGSGNVYVAGYTSGSFNGSSNAGGHDLYVVKFDGSGVWQWTRQLGTAGDDDANGVATDGSGNVYVAGRTTGSLPGFALTGSSDLFVVKFDGAGTRQWIQQLGTGGTAAAYGVTTDGGGNVFVAGGGSGSFPDLSSAGLQDLFVIKLDGAGAQQWVQQLGTSQQDGASAAATDGSGNVYVTGYTTGGFPGFDNAGNYDLFVGKYAPDGSRF